MTNKNKLIISLLVMTLTACGSKTKTQFIPPVDGPIIPSNATIHSDLQKLCPWEEKHDIGTPGTSTGNSEVVSSPSLSGDACQFNMTFTNDGGTLFDIVIPNDINATNFVLDEYVYIENSSAQLANVEMDFNQVISNGNTVIYGFQCDGWKSVWDYAQNAKNGWVYSSQPCNPNNWSINIWHHVQISYKRDSIGNVTYNSVWMDGVEAKIDATVMSSFDLKWAPVQIVNFQIDGRGSSGSNTLLLDKITVYEW